MKAKQDKYIDLMQFPHNGKGQISWKDSVGTVAEFFYNGERHELEILEKIRADYFKIRVDDIVIDKSHTSKITGLMFEKMFYKPNYDYDIGEIVNGLIITEHLRVLCGDGKGKEKAYGVKCAKDGYEFTTIESSLRNGHGCPVCAGKITVTGINDFATIYPELVYLFVDENDAHKYPVNSKVKTKVRCPRCGFEKYMQISEVARCGYVTCDKCSDNVSYPNKFAHELFEQLSDQYLYYEYEYSPDWAGNYHYDNYIEFANGIKVVVEMDGQFHYDERFDAVNNDVEKDKLCHEHDIVMIRVDCNYYHTDCRFNHIKSNVIQKLYGYFDLSCVNWEKCDESGMSSIVYDIAEFYTSHPKWGLDDIARRFKIGRTTIYSYMHMAEKLGLCTYVRADSNRKKDSRPVAMYSMNGTLIGIFKSAKVIAESFPEKEFNYYSMSRYVRKEKPYKGYIFKYVLYEEYLAFDEKDYKINLVEG